MKTTFKVKSTLAALGTCMLLSAGPVMAGIHWTPPFTLFEDDDIDFVMETDANGNLVPDTNATIDIGDTLVAVFELNTAGGVSILPQELTGISAIDLVAFADLDGSGGLNDMIFAPHAAGLDSILALGGAAPVAGGAAGGGAMVSIYLDPTPNLDISAGDVLGGTVSCTTLAQCIAQATDGRSWEVDGFAGDPDESWVALNAQTNTAIVLGSSPGTGFGNFNAGLSILYNGTGRELHLNSIACGVFCGPGGDGFVDILGSGSIKGGLGLTDTLIADGAVATSDFDLVKAVPEPASLALMGIGLLGLGAAKRKGRKA